MYGNYESIGFFQGDSTESTGGSGQGRSERSYESFTELINELYPICLDAGITPAQFSDSTLDELFDLLNSFRRRVENRQKEQIVSNYMLAFQIGERVASMFDKNSKITPVWDLYPDLFKKEKELNDIATTKAEIEAYKARFTAFAYNFNSK